MKALNSLGKLAFFAPFLLISCTAIQNLTQKKPAEAGSPTVIKNGVKYEKLVPEDAKPPIGYTALQAPVLAKKIDTLTTQWKLESFSSSFTSDQGNISYTFYNESNNQYFPEIEKKNIQEIRIIKDSTSGCRVANYKVKIQNQTNRNPMAIAFILDHSGSMGDERADILQAGLDSALRLKNAGDEVTIIKFDNKVSQPVTSMNTEELRRALRPTSGLMGFGQATALQDAVFIGLNELSKSKLKEKQMILITDGCENSSSMTPDIETVIARAIQYKIPVNTIAFGDYTDGNYLSYLSNSTGGYFDKLFQREELMHLFSHYYNRVNVNVKISFTPCMFGDSLTLKTKIKVGDNVFEHKKLFSNKLAIGETIELNVLFDKDKYIIKPEFLDELNSFIDFLKRHPSISIELGGHTDSDGDDDYNLKLSKNRADAIKNYMVKNGINSSRISVVGYGETVPRYPNDSMENMYLNRRTEAKILKL